MRHEIEHGLPLWTAREVIERAVEGYRERFSRFSPRFLWLDENRGEFRLRARGVHLAGTLEVQDNTIAFDLEVPLSVGAKFGPRWSELSTYTPA